MSVYKKLHQIQKNRLQVVKACKANLGGGRVYEYASLDDVLAEAIPALNAAGLALIQSVHLQEQTHVIRTEVVDTETGEKVTSDIAMPVVAKWHDFGSGMTYARRYSLAAMLGIACDADDDATTAMESQRAPVAAPAKKLQFSPMIRKMIEEMKKEGFEVNQDEAVASIYHVALGALDAKPGLKDTMERGVHLADLLNKHGVEAMQRVVNEARDQYMNVPGN